MGSLFDAVGGKTKFFAALGAVLAALEATGYIPPGGVEAGVKVLEALAGAGVIFGFRDAVAKIKA